MMHFRYVGPKDILDDIADAPMGRLIRSRQNVIDWYLENKDCRTDDDEIIATYTVGIDERLRLALRIS